MKSAIIFLVLAIYNIDLVAQSDSSHPFLRKFDTKVEMTSGNIVYGELREPNDSQLVLRRRSVPMTIPAENIASFRIRRKGSMLKGALIGFGAGFIAGAAVGLIEGSDEKYTGPITDPISGFVIALSNGFAMTAGEKAVMYGLGLGSLGSVAGAIMGAVAKKKFTIGGRREKFRDLHAELMKKLVKK